MKDEAKTKKQLIQELTTLRQQVAGLEAAETERLRVEESLGRSEASMAAAQRIAHVGNWETDVSSEGLAWSDEIYWIFGLTPQEFGATVNAFFAAVHPDDLEYVLAAVKEARQGKKTYHVDHRIVRPNGEVRFVHQEAEVTFDERGKPLKMIGIIQDVTERKRAEEALRQYRNHLEALIEARTAELQTANTLLEQEIAERRRAEEALQASQERYRGLVELSPDMVAVVSEGKFVFINSAGARLLGPAAPEYFIGQPLIEFIHPDYRTVLRQQIRQMQREADAKTPLFEEKYIRLDGSEVDVEIASVSLTYQDKPALQLVVRNITARKLAEESLRQSEKQFRLLFEQAPIGMTLVRLDGKLIRINQAFCAMLGYSADEMVGHSVNEFTHPDDLEDNIFLRQEVLREQTSHFQMEKRYLSREGKSIYTLLKAALVRNPQGRPLHFIGQVIDITERIHAEESLRTSESRYRMVVEDQTELICRFWPTGELTFVNGAYCRYFGRQPVELLGVNFFEFIPPEDQAVARAHLASLTPAQPTVTYEHHVITPTGEVCWQQWVDRALFDEQGHVIEIQSVGHDITQRKQAEEELRQHRDHLEMLVAKRTVELTEINEQLKEEIGERQRVEAEQEKLIVELDAFAHTVAHDLQHPLALILGFSEILQMDYQAIPGDELQQYLQSITRSGRKMSNIIDELLLLAGVRKLEVTLKPLDMAGIVAEAQDRLAYIVEEYGAEVIVPPASVWPVALGYAPWVEEIWANYLSNAIKYGGRPPRLELGATLEENSMVRFWLKDNGPGLLPEDQARLFTPFTQLSQVSVKGHGLGLSIVRRIVEKLGGQVGVASDGLSNQGSIFSFTLPSLTD